MSILNTTMHKTIEIDGLDIFDREAGAPENPTINAPFPKYLLIMFIMVVMMPFIN